MLWFPSLLLSVVTLTEDVAFQHSPLSAGSKLQTQLDMDMDMSMKMGGAGFEQTMDMKNGGKRRVSIEALSATKLRVDVPESISTTSNDFVGTQEMQDATHGKSYIAELVDGVVVVTDAEGGAAPEDEQDEVRESCEALLVPNALAKQLAEKPLALGSKLELSDESKRYLLQMEEDEASVPEFDFELLRVEDSGGTTCGVFQATAKLEMSGEEMPGSLEVNLSGPIHVCLRTSRVVSFALEGPLSMDVAMDQGGVQMTVKASGNMALKTSSTIQ